MDSPAPQQVRDWCKQVAIFGVDMLVDHGLLKKEDLDRAADIVAEEILVRLALGDYPPPGA
jgi:hypothetical protein